MLTLKSRQTYINFIAVRDKCIYLYFGILYNRTAYCLAGTSVIQANENRAIRVSTRNYNRGPYFFLHREIRRNRNMD